MTAETYYKEKMLPEIAAFHQEIMQKMNSTEEIEALYFGWRVWFSQISDNPEILFIGINPGSGEDGNDDFEPDGELQYINDESKRFHLKNDTTEVFKDIAKFDLQNCVKTNYYYLATESPKDIETITTFLGRQADQKGLGDKFYYNAKKWTSEIINIVKPQLIICEGVKAFDDVTKYVLGLKINRFKSDDVVKIYYKQLGINIIGYKRRKGGAIVNKGLLKSVLLAL